MRLALNAHLLGSSAGYRRAGIHGYIYQVLDHLPAALPDSELIVFTGRGAVPNPEAYTIKRSWLKTERPTTRILWEQVIQPWQIGGFDLVHELAFAAPLVMPRPFVVTVYDLTFIRYPERLSAARRLYLRLFTGVSCRRARRVMAISQSTAQDLIDLLGIDASKIDLAIPGVEPRFRPLPDAEIEAFRRSKALPERFMLFIGTLEPRKNLATLLQAYAALPEADRRVVHLVIAGGKGWQMEDFPEQIARFGVAETVHLPGYIADSELVLWYNAAEAFVYPSVFEGWGLPVTEALACGKPVLTSNISSLPEAAGEAGVTLPPDDVQAWTEAMRRAIHDPDWRLERGSAGVAQAARFRWADTARQAAESYRKAITWR